jgi:hypothetical protein
MRAFGRLDQDQSRHHRGPKICAGGDGGIRLVPSPATYIVVVGERVRQRGKFPEKWLCGFAPWRPL